MDKYNNNKLNLNLENFEGPIDLLLELGKNQKVDLSKISILKLAEQYLEYINLVKLLYAPFESRNLSKLGLVSIQFSK